MSIINMYRDIGASSHVEGASPTQQITLLFERLQENLSTAKAALETQDKVLKCKKLANAHNILEYFLECLDFNAQPEVAGKLQGIYKNLQQLIFWANAKNDASKLDDAKVIVGNLLEWWSKTNA